VAGIYMLCRGQQIFMNTGKGDVAVDISFPAIFLAIDGFPGGINNKWECANRVRKLFHSVRTKEDEG